VSDPSEVALLRDSLTREASNDAYAIAQQIFKGPQPDVSRVSNEQLDERYRQAFATDDRQYLGQEATRDPAQFMAAMQRLGVQMPPGQQLQPDPALPKSARANVPVPKPPESALQQLFPSPEAVPAAPAPVPSMAVPLPAPGPMPTPIAPAAAPMPPLPPAA